MYKLAVVVKNELKRYFSSPLAYIYLAAFLLMNASFALYLGNILERNSLSLQIMFSYQPWIYLIFIPGIAMRLWAEEFRNKTVVQIITMPVSLAQLVWGKFLASWLFCTLALLLTFPFWLTVNILGTPDNQVIALSYAGSFLLSGCMLAISQTMSALTKNQVIALVLAVFANLLFFLSGIEYVLGFFRGFLPLPLVETIASFSFLSHFSQIISGLIDARDILFFFSIIVLFNLSSILILSMRTAGTTPWFQSTQIKYYLAVIAVLIAGFAGFNMLINTLLRQYQFDATEEKIFTISPATKEVLQNIKEPVVIDFYYSPVLAQRNPSIRHIVEKITVLLQKYQALAGDKLSYRFHYPQSFDAEEDKALSEGLTTIPLPDLNQNAFLGMVISDEADNKKVIPFFALENQDRIEQEITQSLYELSATKKTVGLLSGLPIFGQAIEQNTVSETWAIINDISALYKIKQIQNPEDLQNIDVLMLVHPQNLSDAMIDAIAYYTTHGGKILALLDVAAEAPRLFSPVNRPLTPSNIGKLAQLWGLAYNPYVIAADLENSITVDAGNNKHNANFTQDVVQFRLLHNNMNPDAPETALLKEILLVSATPIEYNGNKNIEYIPLLKSSANSARLPAYAVTRNMNPADILAQFQSDGKEKTLAAKFIGKNPKAPFEVIVIGDSDFMYDTFRGKFKTLNGTSYRVETNNNADFILNALDSLSRQQPSLISLRSKTPYVRQYKNWEQLRKQNLLQFKLAELEILKEINNTQTLLSDIWRKKDFEERQDFTPDELALIASYRKNLNSLREKLSAIRVNLNKNINTQKSRAAFLNLYPIPLLIIGICLLAALRQRKPFAEDNKKLALNRQFLYLSATALLLLFMGLRLSQHEMKQYQNAYYNEPAFPELADKINTLQEISLQNHNGELVFYKKDGIWHLRGYENFPVYQRRIHNFLTNLINARHLEKKSARAAYLSRYGFVPLQDASSPTTKIMLKDQNGDIVTEFEIGRYDVETGRGGRAAYVKFPDRFLVWLVSADFISLSTDWKDWTLSSVLNLRYGRLLKTGETDNADVLANLYKELLNTPLTEAAKPDGKLQTVRTTKLFFENGDSLTLHFYKYKNDYFLQYTFAPELKGNYLQLFAKYATQRFYLIPQTNMEKINHVFTHDT